MIVEALQGLCMQLQQGLTPLPRGGAFDIDQTMTNSGTITTAVARMKTKHIASSVGDIAQGEQLEVCLELLPGIVCQQGLFSVLTRCGFKG